MGPPETREGPWGPGTKEGLGHGGVVSTQGSREQSSWVTAGRRAKESRLAGEEVLGTGRGGSGAWSGAAAPSHRR